MGEDYLTRAEIMNLIYDKLEDYERNIVQPRHEETQSSLRTVIYLLIAALAALAGNLAIKHL